MARPRRLVMLRDFAQLTMLAGVDWLFQNWPSTHIPLLGRSDTLVVLGIVNFVTIAHVWATRAWPRWSARRIAMTWCVAERQRFQTAKKAG